MCFDCSVDSFRITHSVTISRFTMRKESAVAPQFIAHCIRLDDGTLTRPNAGWSLEREPRFVSTRRLLETVFVQDRKTLRIADLGCLEGGYSVEFARMGFQVVGIDVRSSNIDACRYVKSKTDLPNLEFVQDDVWNISRYGEFDAVFCSGLLYHLDRPKEFLDLLAHVTKKCLILQTHFSTENRPTNWFSKHFRKPLPEGRVTHSLSEMTVNEGIPGRWYTEFFDDGSFADRENATQASWDNRRSFWIQREYLIQAVYEAGFDTVVEQFDHFAPDIADNILNGVYREHDRGTFVGIKSGAAVPGSSTG